MATEAATPELAIWISGIGFFSSMLVVLITSIVTLIVKRMDAQQKKDEQTYGYRMEYYKRKLTAGEKAISSITLQLKVLAQARLNYTQILNEIYSNKEINKMKKEGFAAIVSKALDSHFSNNEIYLAYFPIESDFKDVDDALASCMNQENDTILFIIKVKEFSSKYELLPEGKEKENNTRKHKEMDEIIRKRILDYIKLNEKAENMFLVLCKKIQIQLKESINK